MPRQSSDPLADGIVDAAVQLDEQEIEAALRPKRLDEFIGQHRVR
jgi:Holliday junction resolvasome RuvABC ATP-dependent DNA helicase subunit